MNEEIRKTLDVLLARAECNIDETRDLSQIEGYVYGLLDIIDKLNK